MPYKGYFGGVSAMSTNDFKKVNGFSNKFWGWGGEDDDMHERIRSTGLGKKVQMNLYRHIEIIFLRMLFGKTSQYTNKLF